MVLSGDHARGRQFAQQQLDNLGGAQVKVAVLTNRLGSARQSMLA
jgi:hypothetical protein